MEILFILALITKVFGAKRAKFRTVSRQLKKELKFWNEVIVQLVYEINKLMKFIFVRLSTIIKKCICQETVIDEVDDIDLPKNIISFDEYKLKKAK